MKNIDSLFSISTFLNVQGLKNTRWCGRNQVIVRPQVSFYLDGAHTPKSMEVHKFLGSY